MKQKTKKKKKKPKTTVILVVLLVIVIVVLAYMVVQRERQIRILSSTTSTTSKLAMPGPPLILPENEPLTAMKLLEVARIDPQVAGFIADGDYKTYLDILDENDFARLPAIYKDIPRQNVYQINFTKADKALLVIMTPDAVLKVVPVTNLRIL